MMGGKGMEIIMRCKSFVNNLIETFDKKIKKKKYDAIAWWNSIPHQQSYKVDAVWKYYSVINNPSK